MGDNCGHTRINTTFDFHGIGASGNQFCTFTENGLSQHSGGGGAVAGNIRGLGGNLAHHLGAHVLESVFNLDFLGHGYTILGDDRRAKGLLNQHITTLRSKGYLDCIGKGVDTGQHFFPGLAAIDQFF